MAQAIGLASLGRTFQKNSFPKEIIITTTIIVISLHGQPTASLGSSAPDDRLAALGPHAHQKAMGALSF
jgi:hypothetical protein